MSLISPRYECPDCGGYILCAPSTLSSRCKCPDNQPGPIGKHSIGRVPRGVRPSNG